jgi:hypothetical protein
MYSVGKTNFGVNVTNGATWTTRLPPNVTVKAIHYRMPANGANAGTTWTIAVKDSGGAFIDPANANFAPGTAWNPGGNATPSSPPGRTSRMARSS